MKEWFELFRSQLVLSDLQVVSQDFLFLRDGCFQTSDDEWIQPVSEELDALTNYLKTLEPGKVYALFKTFPTEVTELMAVLDLWQTVMVVLRSPSTMANDREKNALLNSVAQMILTVGQLCEQLNLTILSLYTKPNVERNLR